MNKVFVVGFARSGTTLLQSMITENFDFVSFKESHFFFNTFLCPLDHLPVPPITCDNINIRRDYFNKGNILKDFWNDNAIESDIPFDKLITLEQRIDAFIHSLDKTAVVKGAIGWIEKTPAHLRRIGLIQNYVPEARFIHIIRRFSAVYSSWKEASSRYSNSPFRKKTKAQLFKRWSRDIERTWYWLKQAPGEHSLVTYNMLCSAPEATLASVGDFLELESVKSVKTKPTASHKLIQLNEPWKANNYMDIRPPAEKDRLSESLKYDFLYDNMLSEFNINEIDYL